MIGSGKCLMHKLFVINMFGLVFVGNEELSFSEDYSSFFDSPTFSPIPLVDGAEN